MRRGELWTAAGGPDYAGKPRPVLILQSDLFDATSSIVVCGLTSALTATPLPRVLIEPSPANGLASTSAVMVDKVAAVPRRRLGDRIGALRNAEMVAVNRSLLVFLGIAA